jgi:hypothetical protein
MKNLLTWLPLAMVALGGLLTVLGGLWLGIRQVRDGNKATTQNAKILDAAQDAAARAGNAELRQEVVNLRTQLLIAERKGDKNMVRDIVARVPALAEQFDKLNQDKVATVEQMAADYELCWKPTIAFLIAEFDEQVSELKKAKQISEEPRIADFPLTLASDARKPNHIRVLILDDVRLRFTYDTAALNPTGMTAGRFVFEVLGRGSIHPHHFAELSFDFNEANGFGKRFPKPKDGRPPVALTDEIRSAVSKAIEQFLVVAASKTKFTN